MTVLPSFFTAIGSFPSKVFFWSFHLPMQKMMSENLLKAIKGQEMKHLPPDLRKKVNPASISGTLNGEKLEDSQRLLALDFANHTFIVWYPDP